MNKEKGIMLQKNKTIILFTLIILILSCYDLSKPNQLIVDFYRVNQSVGLSRLLYSIKIDSIFSSNKLEYHLYFNDSMAYKKLIEDEIPAFGGAVDYLVIKLNGIKKYKVKAKAPFSSYLDYQYPTDKVWMFPYKINKGNLLMPNEMLIYFDNVNNNDKKVFNNF